MATAMIDEAWETYAEAESAGIRSVYLSHLDSLIETCLHAGQDERLVWVEKLARMVELGALDFPIRMPLFRLVLFPTLLAGVHAGTPNHARWLACFAQLLYKSPECREQLPLAEQTETGLPRAALRANPDDSEARARLIFHLER